MEAFRADGHLTNEMLMVLVQSPELLPEELTRLETAEHLAFCDDCLHRYMELLEGGPLLVPARSCEKTLWSHIRIRAIRNAVSRYATAAAAVALALTMLWGSPRMDFTPSLPLPAEERTSVSRQLTGLTGELNDSLRGAVGGISDFLNGFRPGQLIEGGNKA